MARRSLPHEVLPLRHVYRVSELYIPAELYAHERPCQATQLMRGHLPALARLCSTLSLPSFETPNKNGERHTGMLALVNFKIDVARDHKVLRGIGL